MKLNITWLGQPKEITTRFGPKQKNSIKAKEYGDNFLSFWVSPMTREWAVGKEIEVENVTTREYNGKTYYDIILPKANMGNIAEVMKALEEIRGTLTKHGLMLTQIGQAVIPQKKDNYPSYKEATGLEEGEKHPFDNDDGLDQLNPDEFQGM